jgi:hypothetical protein
VSKDGRTSNVRNSDITKASEETRQSTAYSVYDQGAIITDRSKYSILSSSVTEVERTWRAHREEENLIEYQGQNGSKDVTLELVDTLNRAPQRSIHEMVKATPKQGYEESFPEPFMQDGQ